MGISGASGSIYGGRLLRALVETGQEVSVCFSSGAVEVIRNEEYDAGLDLLGAHSDQVLEAFLARHDIAPRQLEVVLPASMGHAFASGSALADAAVICPCSMSSVGAIAAGITRNLIHRVADVMLKEGRPLVVVPRETPLSEIHLRNLLTIKKAGAQIVPAMPAFYHNPQGIDDLVDFVAGKTLDVLGVGHKLFQRWEGR
ncbi:MAG: UbiX family flavin prenyltransferase [Thermoleophilia bacterium]